VTLRHRRTDAILGTAVPPAESAAILRRLGCEVEEGADAHRVRVPMERRTDLAREIDLIEEVARIHGLDRLPEELPRIVGHGRRTAAQRLAERLARRAADLGLSEAVTYRMVPEGDADLLRLPPDDARRDAVRIANPISEEMTAMRRSLLPGLLRAVAHNQARQRTDGGLFELGRTYAPAADGMADEREWLVAVLFGSPGAGHWRAPAAPVDVWAATGLAGALARAAGVAAESRAPAEPQPYLHPARQAELVAGPAVVARAGEVHPLVLRAAGVGGPVVAVELDREALLAAAPREPARFEDLVTVPVSTRDLAVVVPEGVPAADLVRRAREAGRPLVRDARVFDRYAGAQVEAGHVSLAIRLTLVDPGRTLTDDELDAAVARVVDALAGAGARLRS
jgi:phenylalanyl-tRNA synthetase beta chain